MLGWAQENSTQRAQISAELVLLPAKVKNQNEIVKNINKVKNMVNVKAMAMGIIKDMVNKKHMVNIKDKGMNVAEDMDKYMAKGMVKVESIVKNMANNRIKPRQGYG